MSNDSRHGAIETDAERAIRLVSRICGTLLCAIAVFFAAQIPIALGLISAICDSVT